MQPYQEAGEEIQRQREQPGKFAASLAKGAAYTAGGLALNRVIPFLNKFVPWNLAEKGLRKSDPRMGKFIDTATENGIEGEEIRDFIGEKVKLAEEEQKPAKKNGNIIEQYSPQLNQFIKQMIGKGATPTYVASLTASDNKHVDKSFKDIIKKMEKDHKTDWASIVESIYGGAQQGQPQKPDQGQQQQAPQAQSQQPQSSHAMNALLQAVQAANGTLNKLNSGRQQ